MGNHINDGDVTDMGQAYDHIRASEITLWDMG